MLSKRLVRLVMAILMLPMFAVAQNTTSSITGTAKTASGDPLIGATVTATHEPTGTVYRVQTRAGGRFDIANMNPGGPYTVEVSFVNYETDKRQELYLSLGETSKFEFKLANKGANLGDVAVQSARRLAEINNKGGAGTTIGRDKMENLPTVGRNIQDFLRYTPQAKFVGANGDLAGVSIAGQNNRYNSFYIDGAVNNDVFGLSASGTNGGQAAVGPISVDAIDQFQVLISPYDASIGNFTGGGINATTRGGTNTTQGSIYFFNQNQGLAGKTPNGPKDLAAKLANFSTNTFGFRIGGPIVKNKLFYFMNLENLQNERPQPFTLNQYVGTTNTVAGLDAVVNYVKTTYGYDMGGYIDNPEQKEALRLATKLDWNINDNNRLSLSYRLNKAERINAATSSSNTINFFNNGEFFPSTTNSVSAELKSSFRKGASNRLLLTFTGVNDDRGSIGSPFPRVTINDGAGRLVFGSEEFSTGNLLKQKNIALLDFYKFNLGKNYITVGTDNEFSDSYNVFIRQNYGSYQYASLAAFQSGGAPTRYDRSFSLVDNTTGDNTEAAAKFKSLRLGVFVNDEIKVNDNFTLNFGVRADWTKFLTDPRTDQFFVDTAKAKIEQYYDLKGANSGQISTPKVSISPRIGFTYRIPEENVTVRGGLGMFTGRIPLVWPGGVYNQNGVSIGGISLTTPAQLAGITFRPDAFNQYTAQGLGIGLQNAKGQVDLIAKDFRLPKLFRTSLAVDKRLGKGWTTSLEGIASFNVNEIWYENVNILPPAGKSVGPDARNVYTGNRIPMRFDGSNPYQGNIFLLSNNQARKGFSYSITATLDKAWSKGFAFNMNYTYGSSVVTNEGTSSQNNSQWRFMETVNGRNFVGRTISDYDMGHRINAYVAKKFTYANKNLATTISLVYNGQSGQTFSHVYNGSMVRDNGNGETNDLIYIPTSSQISSMVFLSNTISGVTYTPAQQAAALDAYIANDKYLSKNRGKYAERNGARLPFTHVIDLKITQDFNIKAGGKRYQFQVTYDMFNLTNFLNRDWGRQYFLANDQFAVINFAGYAPGGFTPQYRFNPQLNTRTPWGVSTSTAPSYSARWIGQLGLRFNFN